MVNPRSFLLSQQPLPLSPSPSRSKSRRSPQQPPVLPPRRRYEPTLPIENATKPTITCSTDNAMAERKEFDSRPSTPSSAVEIPVKTKLKPTSGHKARHHEDSARRSSSVSSRRREVQSPDAMPASVRELLAVTSIPSRRSSLRQRQKKEPRMTVDCIVPRSQVSEKDLSQELSLSPFGRSPLEVLLTPPDELFDEEASVTDDSILTSALSTRAGSFDSLPSLGDSLGTASFESPVTPRLRKFRKPRRSLEPVSSPPGEEPEHPLAARPNADLEEVAFPAFDPSPIAADGLQTTVFLPLKTAFKSNLTASIRALRSAARSLSAFTASSVPPQDLLTRSILTADPAVPYTDERRPPVLDDEPSEAMRRYLNPTSSARLDMRTTGAPPTRSYTASIQMQTYKVQRSRSAPPAASRGPAPPQQESVKAPATATFPPGPRQREIRENSDFIRIAVMEHMMHKRGKLDDRAGHARWLLPPRQLNTKPYRVGADGVPVRWIAISQDSV